MSSCVNLIIACLLLQFPVISSERLKASDTWKVVGVCIVDGDVPLVAVPCHQQ